MGNEVWQAVPHLTTALRGPLQQLESCFLQHQADIEQWFRARWSETPLPFYCSVDLRNSGFKLAPVDTNLFPAGFNNLNPAFLPLAVQAVQTAVEHFCPLARGMVLVPENHTRNIHYLESLASLAAILEAAGMNLRIGSLLEGLEGPTRFDLPSGRAVVLEPLRRSGRRIYVGDFDPCVVLLNNDLSAGSPPILQGLEQPVIPALELGWWQRLKSNHFAHYRRITETFADLVDIDPWFIDPTFRHCGGVDFMRREGEERLAASVEEVLEETRRKYREHGITQEPFAIVKSDAGTYGMAIMTVKNAQDVRELNRKLRTKMAYGKEGRAVSEVMVQEGVYTFETWGADNAVAEPVVYIIDRYVIGGFYRVHTARGVDENLNAPGMHFQPLAFAEPCSLPDRSLDPDAGQNRFYAYGVIARLALLAAARELKDVQQPKPLASAAM